MYTRLKLSVLLTGFFIISFAFQASSQSNNAVVIIAQDGDYQCRDEKGFVMYRGAGTHSELKAQGMKDINRQYPHRSNQIVKNSYIYYKHKYLVIIGASTSKNGCSIYTYGVGAGETSSEALEDAKEDLGAKNWTWSSNKYYKTHLEERL